MLKLYYANIKQLDDEKFHILFEKVNMQRREKILRCKNEKDKQRSLLAGFLLREALKQEHVDYENVVFSTIKNGKPVIQDMPMLQFSLSHAGEYAVCVISDRCVGVDIETKSKLIMKNEAQIENIAKRVLSIDEYEVFVNCPSQKKEELFLQSWTRKEAYSKADGRGMGIGFDQLTITDGMCFSKWLDEDTYLSIYTEDGNFIDLQMKEIYM